MKKIPSEPCFFIDSLPDISHTECRELIRSVEIHARPQEIYLWLKQLRVAPYSYDFIDNGRRKSPDYIIENLPPLKVNTHFLLAFHVAEFAEDAFIVGRFCEPVNPPLSFYMQGLYIEYRIDENEIKTMLWCKIKGYIGFDVFSRGFFLIFSIINKIMMARQLKNLKKLSEKVSQGKVRTGKLDLSGYYPRSGIRWWIFCRRTSCRELIT